MQAQWQEHISEYQQGLEALSEITSDSSIRGLVRDICETKLPVVLTGYGASLIVAEKASHHLRSIGVAAVALHPSDAEHGDLGIVVEQSLFIVVSKSGKLDSLENVLRVATSRKCKVYVLTERQNTDSDALLSGHTEFNWIKVKPSKEADRFGIVPTVSVVKQLVILDFVVEAASKELKRTTEDFLSNHPSGNLGRYLNLPVGEFMGGEEGTLYFNNDVNLDKVLNAIEKSKKGICVFLTANNKIYGLLTEGDIRRMLLKQGTSSSLKDTELTELINRTPRIILDTDTVSDAWNQLRKNPPVSSLVAVKSDGSFAGILHARDLRP